MADTQENVQITISISKNTYDVLKAAAPLFRETGVTLEELAAGYIEDRVYDICHGLNASKGNED